MYADILKQKHDIKHQLQVIEQLVASNNSASAQQYLDEYKAKMPQKDDFLTGSISVDALLTAKSLACKHHAILYDKYGSENHTFLSFSLTSD